MKKLKILIVNKFLYPNGGSETYIFKIGKCLESMGHEVAYFGMKDERNIVGNDCGMYTENLQFRSGISLSKILYPFKIIYSVSARKRIAKLLDEFKPDVVHMNNINFQITPSIIYEIKKRKIKMVWTAHDYQLVCPSHSLYIYSEKRICEACLSGNFKYCLRNRCLHDSRMKSFIAMLEGIIYKRLGVYKYVDKIICPSKFMSDKLQVRNDIAGKCIVMHNFIDSVEKKESEKKNYILYFGRFDKEKGISTLIDVCRELKDIKFVFAGSGELEAEISNIENIENVGFVSGEKLEKLIREALFTVYPSEWYENCPFSVMESQMYGVPVVGARIGGIPELVDDKRTGRLFESGNKDELCRIISELYNDAEECNNYAEQCLKKDYLTTEEYCEKMIELYRSLLCE